MKGQNSEIWIEANREQKEKSYTKIDMDEISNAQEETRYKKQQRR